MNALLGVANGIQSFLRVIAHTTGWLLVVLMFVTCIDITCRKLAPVYPDTFAYFPFSQFQELEWHLHAAVFSFWMGFNYTINAHPRVDTYIGTASARNQAWLEFWCCLLFAFPFVLMILYYGWDFWLSSYRGNEGSDAAVGLPMRWIIKGVYYAGLWLLLLGIISVFLKLIVVLFGGRSFEQANLKLGTSNVEV